MALLWAQCTVDSRRCWIWGVTSDKRNWVWILQALQEDVAEHAFGVWIILCTSQWFSSSTCGFTFAHLLYKEEHAWCFSERFSISFILRLRVEVVHLLPQLLIILLGGHWDIQVLEQRCWICYLFLPTPSGLKPQVAACFTWSYK